MPFFRALWVIQLREMKIQNCLSKLILLATLLLCPLPLKAEVLSQDQMNAAVGNYYSYWKGKYLIPSSKVPSDFKINYDGKGTTVSEAMGYGMLIMAFMADCDTNAQACFDGLDRFRKRYPSCINPALMCWRIPPDENAVSDDCATDGDMDMALALILANQKWGNPAYLAEATNLIRNIGITLVRPDFSLRLGDWNSEPGQTRPSDFMPVNFRAFQAATGDRLWDNVESRCYAILDDLQKDSAPATGFVPDFAVEKAGHWVPAKPDFLETEHDSEYYYNSCRVPWRIGWGALVTGDERAERILQRFMSWTTTHVSGVENFKAGYQLDGRVPEDCNFSSACFIAPIGVAAMAIGNQSWMNGAFSYGMNRRKGYFGDTVNLLCLLAMSGKARLAIPHPPRSLQWRIRSRIRRIEEWL